MVVGKNSYLKKFHNVKITFLDCWWNGSWCNSRIIKWQCVKITLVVDEMAIGQKSHLMKWQSSKVGYSVSKSTKGPVLMQQRSTFGRALEARPQRNRVVQGDHRADVVGQPRLTPSGKGQGTGKLKAAVRVVWQSYLLRPRPGNRGMTFKEGDPITDIVS